jgi:hypothetical protein
MLLEDDELATAVLPLELAEGGVNDHRRLIGVRGIAV